MCVWEFLGMHSQIHEICFNGKSRFIPGKFLILFFSYIR